MGAGEGKRRGGACSAESSLYRASSVGAFRAPVLSTPSRACQHPCADTYRAPRPSACAAACAPKSAARPRRACGCRRGPSSVARMCARSIASKSCWAALGSGCRRLAVRRPCSSSGGRSPRVSTLLRAITTMLKIRFRSCRTLPGQGWLMKCCSSRGSIDIAARPQAAADSRRNTSANSGMSSGRSRSGGR